jgi:hypothetical protein
MRYLKLFLVLLAVGGFAGCRKPSPTSYMRAYSIHERILVEEDSWSERFPSEANSLSWELSWHQFTIASVSPSFVPEVKFNGWQIPRENIDQVFGEFRGEDTLPKISPYAEVQMEVKYRDLNEKYKTASSKVKLPPEPYSVILSITGSNIWVAWGKPNKKFVSFVYVGIDARCYYKYYSSSNFKDTVITNIEKVTEVSVPLGTICAPISNPDSVFTSVRVINFYGPWYGSKDNIKGIKGQYYGGSSVVSFKSWPPSPSVAKFDGKFNLNREEFFKRMINTIEKHFGVQDEGSWINGF